MNAPLARQDFPVLTPKIHLNRSKTLDYRKRQSSVDGPDVVYCEIAIHPESGASGSG
jgi:hypothetical protein